MDVAPFTDTDLTAYGLLLLALLFGLNIWLTHKKGGNGNGNGAHRCPYHHDIKEVHRMLEQIARDHSEDGDHHKALERTERRVVAVMRHHEVRDPDGQF